MGGSYDYTMHLLKTLLPPLCLKRWGPQRTHKLKKSFSLMPEMTEATDKERMEAPKKTWIGFRRLRSHRDAQGRRKTVNPRNHCGHRKEVPGYTTCDQRCTSSPTPRAHPARHCSLALLAHQHCPTTIFCHPTVGCLFLLHKQQAGYRKPQLQSRAPGKPSHPCLSLLLPVLAQKLLSSTGLAPEHRNHS